jgi:hypothetical protein
MSEEVDPGIDKQGILAEIGAGGSSPAESPVRGRHSEPPSRLPAPPRDLPAGALSAMAPPTLPEPPPPPGPPLSPRQRQGRVARHRRQIAAILLVFVAMIWFGVALATQERAPFAFGGGFLGLAILTGAGSLLRES